MAFGITGRKPSRKVSGVFSSLPKRERAIGKKPRGAARLSLMNKKQKQIVSHYFGVQHWYHSLSPNKNYKCKVAGVQKWPLCHRMRRQLPTAVDWYRPSVVGDAVKRRRLTVNRQRLGFPNKNPGGDSAGPRTPTTPPPPKGASGQQLVVKGMSPRSQWAL